MNLKYKVSEDKRFIITIIKYTIVGVLSILYLLFLFNVIIPMNTQSLWVIPLLLIGIIAASALFVILIFVMFYLAMLLIYLAVKILDVISNR